MKAPLPACDTLDEAIEKKYILENLEYKFRKNKVITIILVALITSFFAILTLAYLTAPIYENTSDLSIIPSESYIEISTFDKSANETIVVEPIEGYDTYFTYYSYTTILDQLLDTPTRNRVELKYEDSLVRGLYRVDHENEMVYPSQTYSSTANKPDIEIFDAYFEQSKTLIHTLLILSILAFLASAVTTFLNRKKKSLYTKLMYITAFCFAYSFSHYCIFFINNNIFTMQYLLVSILLASIIFAIIFASKYLIKLNIYELIRKIK